MAIGTDDPKLPVNSKLLHPYKTALARRVIIASAPIPSHETSYWKKSGAMSIGDVHTHSATHIRQKLEALRASSSPNHPVYFRCGDEGHFAPDFHNATLCFLCNRLGHKARWCRSVIDLPPLTKPVLPKSDTHSFPPLQKPLKPPPTIDMHRHTPINAPVAHFFSNPDSEALEQHFR